MNNSKIFCCLVVTVLLLPLTGCKDKTQSGQSPPADRPPQDAVVDTPPTPANVPAPPAADSGSPTSQPAPSREGDENASAWLSAHNKHRQKKDLPALVWSDELARIAQAWTTKLASEQCGELAHRPADFLQPKDIGENLASASASPNPSPRGPTWAVDDWAAEEQYYDYAANRCQSGKACGHYTQVVWRTTREVGCAEATCRDGEWHTKVWACNYRPAGNVVGQKPY